MGTATITWKRPRMTDGTGNPVNEGTDLPRFKGRKNAKPSELAAQLQDALDDLARSPCAYWACEGPNRVRYMCTCCKCYAVREVEKVRAALARM